MSSLPAPPPPTSCRSSTASSRFTLNRAARIGARVETARRGFRSGRACRPVRRPASGRACTRWATTGTFSIAGRAGANAVAFTGVVRRRPLPAGRHRVVLTPPAGGTPVMLAFRIR